MYRQSIVKAARPALRVQSSAIRTFTTTQRIMAEGDLGATRATGYVGFHLDVYVHATSALSYHSEWHD